MEPVSDEHRLALLEYWLKYPESQGQIPPHLKSVISKQNLTNIVSEVQPTFRKGESRIEYPIENIRKLADNTRRKIKDKLEMNLLKVQTTIAENQLKLMEQQTNIQHSQVKINKVIALTGFAVAFVTLFNYLGQQKDNQLFIIPIVIIMGLIIFLIYETIKIYFP